MRMADQRRAADGLKADRKWFISSFLIEMTPA